ncbi:MAG TPA: alpha/beta hydrolase family protein [Mycobacterium sp.]|nr:alpha/beta hydrolase family protein [Mycobacterium sp.]
MRGLSMLLRTLCAVVLTLGMWGTGVSVGRVGTAHGAEFENLMVPSPSMGRDIPVAFMGGGPHAVYLLDAFNAAPELSNWVTAGNAMNTLAGKGLSVVAPAGGAYSMYTNWEKDQNKQWDTFLGTELPDWLAANKGLAPGGHAVVGASQGGYGAMALACFHPDRFGFAGSLSGFLYPAETTETGVINDALQRYGGLEPYGMWGSATLGRWKWHDPNQHVQLLASNNTRLWVYSPMGPTPDMEAMMGNPAEAAGSARFFYKHYREVRGHNGHWEFPPDGENGWGGWSQQLVAMTPDIIGAIR